MYDPGLLAKSGKKSGILNMKSGILNIGGGFGGAFSTFKKFLNVEDIYLASMG